MGRADGKLVVSLDAEWIRWSLNGALTGCDREHVISVRSLISGPLAEKRIFQS